MAQELPQEVLDEIARIAKAEAAATVGFVKMLAKLAKEHTK